MCFIKDKWEDDDCVYQLVQEVSFNILQGTMKVTDEYVLITIKEKK